MKASTTTRLHGSRKGLPSFPLDCEIFAGYGKRKLLNGITRWRDPLQWSLRSVQLVIFDAPDAKGGYQERREAIMERTKWPGKHRTIVARSTCAGRAELLESLNAVLKRGGEGLMIRKPDARYTFGRVSTLLQVTQTQS